MASSAPKDEVEPPRKRQRLSPTITNSSSGAKMEVEKMDEVKKTDGTVKQTVVSDTGFQPEREKEVGILHFVNAENLGFTGTLKQRYTDFLVNEIAPDGTVVHLTNDRVPKIKRDVLNKEEDFKSTTNATNDSASSSTVNSQPTSSTSTQQGFPALPEPTKVEDASLVIASETGQGSLNETEAPAAPCPTGVPAKDDSKDAFHISPDDNELLVKYFGATLKDALIEFHEKVLAKPTAKPAVFGNLLSEPITDRPLRGKLHHDVRRIFNSRLETESIEEGKINITAAPPVKTAEGYVRKENPRHQNSRNQNQPRGKVGWGELGGEHLHFSLYKENKDTMEVIQFLCRMLKVKPKDFAFAGTKDRRAVTVQRVSVFRQHAHSLARLNPTLRQARIGDFKHEKNRLELGELDGNEFQITLRDCHFGEDDSQLNEAARLQLARDVVDQAVQHLQAHGFINYFGLQRFGTFGIGTDEVGKKILMDDFEGAVNAILTFNQDTLEATNHPEQFANNRIGRDDLDRAWALNSFKSTGKSREALEKLPRKFSAESNIIRHLGTGQNKVDFSGALLMVNRNLRTMYVHAYQSLVWNHVASKRWEKNGSRVTKGDLVLVDTPAEKAAEVRDEVDENGEVVIHPAADDAAFTHDDFFQRARPLTAVEAESGKYTIFDIVLPTPGYDIEYPNNDIGDYYKEFMGSERGGGLDPADMRRKIKDFSLSGSYRKLIGQFDKDMSFDIKTYYDDIEQLVETDLEKLQKSRGQDPRVENAPRHQNEQFNNGFPNPREGYQGGRGGHISRGGRQNDFYTNRSNGRQQANFQAVTPARPSVEDRSALRAKPDQGREAALSAWQNLPKKLAADDKAFAAQYEASRLLPRNLDDIPQPTYKDTFIENSNGTRTGFRSTEIIPPVKSHKVLGSVPASDEDTIMKETEVVEPSTTSDAMAVDPKASALAKVTATETFTKSFGSDGSDDSSDGGVRLSTQTSPVLKPSPSKLSNVENADPATQDAKAPATSTSTEGSNGSVKLSAHESSVQTKRSAHEISTEVATKAPIETSSEASISKLDPETPTSEQAQAIPPFGMSKSPLNTQSPTFEPESKVAKIAVIIKFALGTSQYATMALRELMKSGGVKTYKPDFSGGR